MGNSKHYSPEYSTLNIIKRIVKMKNYKSIVFLGLLFGVLLIPSFALSQKESETEELTMPEFDQLIPQQFAFDKEHGVFAAISIIDNTIDIIKHDGSELSIINKYLVDNFDGRHDVHHIYRPQGVAMYEGYIVFLASHRDSCYFAVLDLEGNLVKRHDFRGNAFAFSYSPSEKELYIAGQNELGYDLIVIGTADGIQNIEPEKAAALHYQKPKKGEEIKEKDPVGIGITVVAMSVVFLSLILLTVVFMGYGKLLVSIQGLRARLFTKKHRQATGEEIEVVKPGSVSGEEFAAISAAIYMFYNELHDEENTRLTIKKAQRSWTPWNAKFYSMNQYFSKRS